MRDFVIWNSGLFHERRAQCVSTADTPRPGFLSVPSTPAELYEAALPVPPIGSVRESSRLICSYGILALPRDKILTEGIPGDCRCLVLD